MLDASIVNVIDLTWEREVTDRIAERRSRGDKPPAPDVWRKDVRQGVVARLAWIDGAWSLETTVVDARGIEFHHEYDLLEVIEATKRKHTHKGHTAIGAYRLGVDTEQKLLESTETLLNTLGHYVKREGWEGPRPKADEYDLPIHATFNAVFAGSGADQGDIYRGSNPTGWRKFERGYYEAKIGTNTN